MLPNTALAVFLPSRGAVIHKRIFSYNSSADDPVIADSLWSSKGAVADPALPSGVVGFPPVPGPLGVSPPCRPNARHHSLPVGVLLGISAGPSPSNGGIRAFERVTVPNLANSAAQPGRGKARAVPLHSGNDLSILPKVAHTCSDSGMLMWKAKPPRFCTEKSFCGDGFSLPWGLAALCLHCPGRERVESLASRFLPIQHGQGHPTRDDVQSPPFCTAPALEKPGHRGGGRLLGVF